MAVNLSIVKKLEERLRKDFDVIGILLFGSLAVGKITRRSDVDVMVMVQKERDYWRDCRLIEGIWVEQYFRTYENLKKTIERRELTHVYMFKEGKILYDPEGRMAELKSLATRIVEDYKPSEDDILRKRLEVQLFIDDILDMYESEDMNSTIYYLYDNQYIVLDALFILNSQFPPKFKETFQKFKELAKKPTNFDELMETFLWDPEPKKRLKAFLELANWILDKLGGRLTEIRT